MRVEQLMFPVVSGIAKRPKVSKAIFGRTKWGDPFAPARFSYPYDIYDTMRADGPVVFNKLYQQWFVFGYDEIHEVFRSPHATTSSMVEVLLALHPYNKLSANSIGNFKRWLLVTDPPEHSRLRGAVSRAFTPRRIASFEPRIQTVVKELLSSIENLSEVEIVSEFTARLPIYVIAELLGLPRDRWEWLRAASAEIAGILEAFAGFDPVSMNRRFDELHAYFATIIEQRRLQPQDDLISAMIAEDAENQLDTDEVMAMIALLMFAGHETTTGLLGNAIVALAQHPKQRELLRSKPELIDNAVEEFLRFDPPAQTSARFANQDLVIGGKTIRKGATIALMIGAANRDTRQWPDANELRLDRPDPKPISFGHGVHYCIGASLARLESRVALPAFLASFGDYTIDLVTAKWKRSHTLRGPVSLQVRR
jgi:cytochrome P450